jgi:hypothetical protein
MISKAGRTPQFLDGIAVIAFEPDQAEGIDESLQMGIGRGTPDEGTVRTQDELPTLVPTAEIPSPG